MARLLPLLLALVGVLLLAAIARQQTSRSRSEHTFRPRANPRRGFDERATGTEWVVSRAELQGLRDAYSSAAIDPALPLYRCGGCQAFYHQSSVDRLRAENRSGCALCGSRDLRAVHVLS